MNRSTVYSRKKLNIATQFFMDFQFYILGDYIIFAFLKKKRKRNELSNLK